METGRFDEIIIIGSGKIASTVLKYVISLKSLFTYQLTFVSTDKRDLSKIEYVCSANNVGYLKLKDKEATLLFENLASRALIISAGNNYLFPGSVVEKENVEIINFHYALLPKYRGRNAPSWAIYNNEKESGATWYYVTVDINGGNIIWQGRCNIDENMRAYQLSKKLWKSHRRGLRSFFQSCCRQPLPVHHRITRGVLFSIQNRYRVMGFSICLIQGRMFTDFLEPWTLVC